MRQRTRAVTAALSLLVGSALVTAPAATAAPPPAAAATTADPARGSTAALVQAWYEDFLDRDADVGAAYWVDRIDAGAKPADQLWAITHSDEYDRAHVQQYYQVFLARQADAGARYWIDGVDARRFPLEWAQQNIASSPEAVRVAGSRANLIEGWYITTVGGNRNASPGDVAYWSARIDEVGTLGAYRELYYAPEPVDHRLRDWYALLLNRDVDDSGRAYWTAKEIESDIDVGVLIASTQEYRERDRDQPPFDDFD